MSSSTNRSPEQLIDEIWKLVIQRSSTPRRLDLFQLSNTLIQLNCNHLETSIPEEVPMPLLIQLVDIRILYNLLHRDNTNLDRSLKRGLRNVLQDLSSRRAEDPLLSNAESFGLLNLCARLLQHMNVDDEWRLLDEMFATLVEQLRQMAEMQ